MGYIETNGEHQSSNRKRKLSSSEDEVVDFNEQSEEKLKDVAKKPQLVFPDEDDVDINDEDDEETFLQCFMSNEESDTNAEAKTVSESSEAVERMVDDVLSQVDKHSTEAEKVAHQMETIETENGNGMGSFEQNNDPLPFHSRQTIETKLMNELRSKMKSNGK